jgi:hypothetical protein
LAGSVALTTANSLDERRLFADLLKDYNRYVRPVQALNETLHVSFGVAIIQLYDLDERLETMHMLGWLRMLWNDHQLAWNPAEYGNIIQMRLPIDRIWTPDITLYNSADAPSIMAQSTSTLSVVSNDGTVLWIPPVIINSRCDLDLYYFPFDKQQCQLIFGSWTHSAETVNINFYDGLEDVDHTDYTEHAEWRITNTSAVRNAKVYPCCDEAYPDLTFTLHLARNAHHHMHLFVAPSVALAFLMPAMFIMPAERPEKVTLGVGLLVCQTLLLGAIQQYLPSAHPVVPLIGVYYLTNIVLTGLSLFFATIVISVWSRSSRNAQMPGVVRSVMLGGFGRLLCVKRETYMPLENMETPSMRKLEVMSDGDNNSIDDDRARIMQTSARAACISEWRQLAVILDRLLFLIFLVIAILVIMVMGSH